MDKGMTGEFVFACVRLATHDAGVRPLAGVDARVHHEALVTQEALAARAAVVREVVRVDAHVDLELVSTRENFAAQVTHLL